MAKKIKNIIREEHRAVGPLSLAEGLSPIVKQLLGKTGLVQADLFAEWSKIIGEELSAYTIPQKLDFKKGHTDEGILHLAVRDGAFALEVAGKKTFIIDKINTFFGYRAVSDVRTIINDALFAFSLTCTKDDDKSNKTLVNPKQKKYIDNVTEGIQNPDLKARLQSLGESILRETK